MEENEPVTSCSWLIRVGLSVAVLMPAAIGTGCQDRNAPSEPTTIEDVMVWLDTLHLEQGDSSIVAEPNLRPGLNGWLYWDTQLQVARKYSTSGEFLLGLGGPGEGPGEFKGLAGVAELDDQRLVTIDARGHLAIWSANGVLEQDIATGIISPRGLVAVSGGKVAVVLRPHQAGDSVWGLTVQILDPQTGAAERTVARIPLNPQLLTAAYTVQPTAPHVQGDTVLVTLLDYVWTIPLSRGQYTSYHIRGPSGDSISPVAGGNVARGEVREWLMQTTFIGEFGRLTDGRWVVGTYRVLPGQVQHGLRLLNAVGNPLWELETAPPLLGVGPEDRLYFGDPAGMQPSHILVARLRQEP